MTRLGLTMLMSINCSDPHKLLESSETFQKLMPKKKPSQIINLRRLLKYDSGNTLVSFDQLYYFSGIALDQFCEVNATEVILSNLNSAVRAELALRVHHATVT